MNQEKVETGAISPDGGTLYVANANDGTVSIIDTATNTVANSISVPGVAGQVVLSRSGSSAYVQSYIRLSRRKFNNYLNIIDTATQTQWSMLLLDNT
jgi:YVTN family beta-propeller protein